MTKPRKPRSFKISDSGEYIRAHLYYFHIGLRDETGGSIYTESTKIARRVGEALIKWSDWKDGTRG